MKQNTKAREGKLELNNSPMDWIEWAHNHTGKPLETSDDPDVDKGSMWTGLIPLTSWSVLSHWMRRRMRLNKKIKRRSYEKLADSNFLEVS